MRKCLRCEAEMQEGYALYDESFHGRVLVGKEKKFFPKIQGRLHCAVCPECGYTELYVENSAQGENL